MPLSDSPKPVLTGEQVRITRIHADAAENCIDLVAFAFEHGFHEDGVSSERILRDNANLVASIVSGEVVCVKRREILALGLATAVGAHPNSGATAADIYAEVKRFCDRLLATPATQEEKL